MATIRVQTVDGKMYRISQKGDKSYISCGLDLNGEISSFYTPIKIGLPIKLLFFKRISHKVYEKEVTFFQSPTLVRDVVISD